MISIKPNYQGATNATGSYAIAPMQGYVKDSADALRGFVNQYGALLASIGPWSTAASPADARTALGLGPLAIWQSGQVFVLPGSAGRFQADFSNSTHSNRFLFQSSTTNGVTSVGAITNGTGNTSNFTAWGNSDASNGSYAQLGVIGGTDARIQSGSTGSGAQLPLTFWTNNAERFRVDTAGKLCVGATANEGGSGSSNVVFALGAISATGGFRCRPGVNGTPANVFNINWTGVPNLWVDASNIGQLSIVSSDARIKQDIEPLQVDYRERIRGYQVVTFRFREATLWGQNTELQQGFIAQQVGSVNPQAATGDPDSVNENGSINPMGINDRAIISDLVGAFQQLEVELEEKYQTLQSQERRIADLEARIQQALAALPAA